MEEAGLKRGIAPAYAVANRPSSQNDCRQRPACLVERRRATRETEATPILGIFPQNGWPTRFILHRHSTQVASKEVTMAVFQTANR